MVILMFTIYGCSEDEALVERSIDGVAAYLGYYDGEYPMHFSSSSAIDWRFFIISRSEIVIIAS